MIVTALARDQVIKVDTLGDAANVESFEPLQVLVKKILETVCQIEYLLS